MAAGWSAFERLPMLLAGYVFGFRRFCQWELVPFNC